MQFTQTEFKTKSILIHDFIRTADTNLHQVDLEVNLNASEIDQITLQNLEQSRLLEAASFPISAQCLEFVIACVRHYNPTAREIQLVDGQIICNLKPKDIEKCFGIPPNTSNLVISMEKFENAFNSEKEKCQRRMAERWIKQKRTTLPKNVGHGEFRDEYVVMITLLNRVTGQADANKFQPCMYYIMAQLVNNKEHYDWDSLISDVLHKQMIGFLVAHEFHMCSNLVDLIAFQG